MSFGKRAVRVKKDVSSENTKKIDNKNDSSHGNNSSINSNDSISDHSVKQNKTKKQSKKTSFLKKISKNKTSNILLFNMTKEEKLKQFIKNIKIIHPNIPDFWLQKETEKFKKKFGIQTGK